MKQTEMKDKEGNVMTTDDGKVMMKNKFETGDEFIPLWNNLFTRTNKVIVDGQEKLITNHTLVCKVRDKDGNVIDSDDGRVYVELTPGQAKKLQSLINDGVELNQQLFICYSYESKEHGGTHVGIGLKELKPAKSFDDFE